MKSQQSESKECVYCSGKGYFQLILGGSETCTSCEGSGKK
ncbi:YuiA family protein [Fredinandcohnia quinoae]|uniref:YuiA family protein n=1 Tax=Fredinandcohnia quinoae TaxID=2918902 RepID=A0AAW5E9V1_9BACI|nr:YuiA family protein [Fredinandcohnia sp. SECRCQ15]MCH1625524.1 YuiA family protein [Fredinandcohnia sp. SECRCQ15]